MAQALSYFVTDDRRTVPTLLLLVGQTEETVRRLAAEDLAANPHHQAIEVCDGDVLLFALARPPERAADL